MKIEKLVEALREADRSLAGDADVFVSFASAYSAPKEIQEVVSVVRQDGSGFITIVLGKDVRPLGGAA